MSTQVSRSKSFWERPEGITGAIFMAFLVAGIGYGLFILLPFIITILTNTLYTIGLGIVLFALLYMIFDGRFQASMWFLYKIFMRKLTGFIVTIDPIEIMKVHIQGLRDRREEMNESLARLKGDMQGLERTIKSNEAEINKAKAMASSAQKQGNTNIVALQARQAGRYQESTDKLYPLMDKLKKLYTFISKLYDNSDFLIQDMEAEVHLRKIEYEALKKGTSAINSAKKIFAGSEKDEIYQQSIEFLEQDMSQRIGDIDRFMDTTKSIMDSIDVEKGMFEEKGMQMLEEWKESDFTFLLNKKATDTNSPQVIAIPNTQYTHNQNSNTNSNLFD